MSSSLSTEAAERLREALKKQSGRNYISRRSGYKLIPQSNSDNSELSDEELSDFCKDGFQIITKKKVYPFEPSAKRKIVENRLYTDVMPSETYGAKSANCASSTRISQEAVLQKTRVLSMKRKFSFSFSIFTCFFVITLFLAVPCEWANCACSSSKSETHELWEMRVPNIELMGPIILVHTNDWFNMNFLLMARGSVFADAPVIRTNYTSSSGGDIIAFHGLTGQQLWRKHYNKMPSEVDCKLLSLRNRLPKDCMIVSYGNYVTVISPQNGRTFWILQLNIRNNRTEELFPVIIPDVDHDTVLDLVMIKDVNKIQLVSGLNGTVLNGDFDSVSKNCTEIKDLRMHNEFLLKLNCKKQSGFVEINLPLQAYLTPASLNSKQILTQHYPFASLNRMYVHNYTIQFENEGSLCPKSCKAKIWIQNANTTVWSYEAKNSFIMTPVTFDLNYSAGVFGFVVKTWEFEHQDTNPEKLKSPSHNEHELAVSFLCERIFLIVFNHSMDEPVHVANMTNNSIIQLYGANKSIQPDPKMQQHSLIVDDVNRKGSRHLITYYSTFEVDNRDNSTHTDYTLKSYIRMYDLLAEIKRNWA